MAFREGSIKKVLTTADTVGGVWTYALDLCQAFLALDIQVCIATMGAPLSATQWLQVNEIPNLEVRESRFKLEWMNDPWDDLDKAGQWLLGLEKEIQPDIVHLNGYVHAALNWHSPVVVVAHSCVLSWWKAVLKEQAPADWDRYKNAVQQGLQAADAVVSISNSYARDITELYGPLSNLSVIYNGRDSHLFYTATKKNQAFAMGRIWDEAKNLSILGKITNTLELPVLVAGDNRHPENGEPVTIPNVTFLGLLSHADVRKQLSESLIYILPAKYEPFGLSVVEAALSGCLLLLADIPTLRELWQDTGLYFDPEKPTELDKLLLEAMQNKEEIQQLVKRSTEKAKNYSIENMAESYLNLYHSLVHKKLETEV